MSFTSKIKDELLALDILGYEYLGFVITRRLESISFVNKSLGRFFYQEIKKRVKAEIEECGKIYRINYSVKNFPLPKIKKEKWSLLRGCFMSSGYASDPFGKQVLDISFKKEEDAIFIKNILESFGILSSIHWHREKFKLSLRSSENIMNFLLGIGAKNSFFEYEDILILKSLKLKNIRSVNLEVANDERKALSTSKQLAIISKLKQRNKISKLPSKLLDFIEERENNYDLSLLEIADKLSISRSSLRRRIKLLEEIAEK